MREKRKLIHAARALREGELVVFPTETVYGLGADASNSKACAKIFLTKNRPATNPLIVHAASLEMLQERISALPSVATSLFKAFTPGPLTIIVGCKDSSVCKEVRAGGNTVALRIPAHPVAQRLIQAANCLVAAPSANISGKPSASTYNMAKQAMKQYNIPVLNGGDCKVGIESTILDASRHSLRIIRPGIISRQQLEEACGMQIISHDTEKNTKQPQYPGMSLAHYQPSIPVYLFSDPHAVLSFLDAGNTALGLIVQKNSAKFFRSLSDIVLKRIVRDYDHYARILYKSFFEMEQRGCTCIFCELPASTEHAVYDRLCRASA